MTKREFFRKLQFHLWLRVPGQKRQQIIADYEDFFAAGLAQGETEQALCARFGAPHEIAAEVAEREARRVSVYHVAAFLLFLLLFLCVLPALRLYFTNKLHRVVLAVVSLGITLLLAKPFQTEAVSRKLQIMTGALIGLGMLSFAWVFTFIMKLIYHPMLLPARIGELVAFMTQSVAILLLVACVVLGACARRLSVAFLPLVPLTLLFLGAIVEVINIMTTMTNQAPSFLPELATVTLLHLPALLTAIFWFVKRRSVWTRK